jgi:hypothetical protein
MAVPDYPSLMLPLLKFDDEHHAEISTGDAQESGDARRWRVTLRGTRF